MELPHVETLNYWHDWWIHQSSLCISTVYRHSRIKCHKYVILKKNNMQVLTNWRLTSGSQWHYFNVFVLRLANTLKIFLNDKTKIRLFSLKHKTATILCHNITSIVLMDSALNRWMSSYVGNGMIKCDLHCQFKLSASWCRAGSNSNTQLEWTLWVLSSLIICVDSVDPLLHRKGLKRSETPSGTPGYSRAVVPFVFKVLQTL